MDEARNVVSWLSLLASVIGTSVVILNSAILYILAGVNRRVERLEEIFLNAPWRDLIKERRDHVR